VQTTTIRIARGLVWFLYAWVVVTIVLLFMAFILQLFAANPQAGFVEWVYRSTTRAMAPFRGIFQPVELSERSTLDVSILFAMVVYLFVALGLNAAVEWVSARLHQSERTDREQAQLQAQVAASAAPIGPERIVQLAGPAGAAMSARLTPFAWGTAVELRATGLDPARSYVVWVDAPQGGRVELGTFRPDDQGTASVSLSSAAVLAHSRRFGVVQGPGGGDPGSTDLFTAELG
jgi:uncharacterized protein YggT (Ycf19 family)